jgi:hypothetical protein
MGRTLKSSSMLVMVSCDCRWARELVAVAGVQFDLEVSSAVAGCSS